MKKLSFIALASLLVVAVGTGMAFGAAYDVTSNFGVRVTEKGVSEQVGATTLTPLDNLPANAFLDGQIITVELLGNATISHTIAANYAWPGGGADPVVDGVNNLSGGTANGVAAWKLLPANAIPDPGYQIVAIEGQDFFTITVVDTLAALGGTDVVIYGHEEESQLCFNLEDTIYNSNDPAQQLVKVSYGDNQSNTYSGDSDVATVKPKSITVEACYKEKLVEIIDSSAQGPECGPYNSGETLCIEFSDTATGSFPAAIDYKLALGNEEGGKAGVGIGPVSIVDSDGNPVAIDVTTIVRKNRTGQEIELADFEEIEGEVDGIPYTFSADAQLYAATAYIEFEFQFTALASGPDTYEITAPLYEDTCLLTPGDYTVDLAISKVPCGSSFTEEDILVATFVEGIGNAVAFPYAVAGVGTWFNGLVITNPGSSDVTVEFDIKEADGDEYTGSVTVAGGQMAVGFAADVMSPVAAEGSTDAAFGDEPYAIKATGNGLFYGFIFIGNGTMAQGYLPIDLAVYNAVFD